MSKKKNKKNKKKRHEPFMLVLVTILAIAVVVLTVMNMNRPSSPAKTPVASVKVEHPAPTATPMTAPSAAPAIVPTSVTGTPEANGKAGATGKTGSTGTAGKDGANGKDGAGIVKIACNPDGTWLFTLADSSTQTVSGPCSAVNGTNGATGPAGAPVNGWTYVDGYGFRFTCVQNTGFVPTVPQYHCYQG